MKSRLFVLLLTAVVVTLTSGRTLQADSTEIWNTENITTISHNSFPQIKGNYLVWQGRGGLEMATSGSGDLEIFLYDIDNQVEIQLTDDDYDDISPQTDKDYVVWQKHDTSRGNQIFLYDIHGENPPGGLMISNDDKDNYSPQIAAGQVVWTSQRVAHSFEPGEIMLYDAKNLSGPHPISDNTLNCSFPRINSETVIWVQADENGTTTLFIYDLTKKNAEPEPAPEGYVWGASAQSDGILTVSTWYDGEDWEIIIHNKYLKGFEQITNNTLDDGYPRISGNKIAWMAGEGKMREIFLAEYKCLIPLSPEDNAVLPRVDPLTFTWKAIDYDKFKVQFSPNEDFHGSGTFTLPLRRRKWLSGDSFTPNRWQWRLIRGIARRNGHIYWRVKGKDSEGNEALSEVRKLLY